MHRLPVKPEHLQVDALELPKEALNHFKVLRPREGEKFELFDGEGGYRIYTFKGFNGKVPRLEAEGELKQEAPRSDSLTLFACITKGSRWDWTLEKATELGVKRIVPVISERTIVRIPKSERKEKRERWQRIAEEATRQSHQRFIPEILEAKDFDEALELVKTTKCLIGALTEPPSENITKVKGNAVFIGPEGDFTPEELSELMKVATPVSFGPQILRAETAAIFAISVMSAYGTL